MCLHMFTHTKHCTRVHPIRVLSSVHTGRHNVCRHYVVRQKMFSACLPTAQRHPDDVVKLFGTILVRQEMSADISCRRGCRSTHPSNSSMTSLRCWTTSIRTENVCRLFWSYGCHPTAPLNFPAVVQQLDDVVQQHDDIHNDTKCLQTFRVVVDIVVNMCATTTRGYANDLSCAAFGADRVESKY